MRGAIAARCAAEQGKYWELRHTMIVNASQLQPDKIEGYAANVSMDVHKFKSCVAADKFKASIDKDIAEGTAAGINGTPSFVLGRVKDGKLTGRAHGRRHAVRAVRCQDQGNARPAQGLTDRSVRLITAAGLVRASARFGRFAVPSSRRATAADRRRDMRWLLLCFALGVLLLQQQPSLPSLAGAAWVAGFCRARLVACVRTRLRCDGALAGALASPSLIVGGIGCRSRRDSSTPPGAPRCVWPMNCLPHGRARHRARRRRRRAAAITDRGTRFAFAVERIETPDAERAVAHFARLVRGRPRRRSRGCRAVLHAGERWRSWSASSARTAPSIRTASTSRRGCWSNDLRATGYVRKDAGNRGSMRSPAAPTTTSRARASRYAIASWRRSAIAVRRRASPRWRSATSARFRRAMATVQPHRHRPPDQHLGPARHVLRDADRRARVLAVEAQPCAHHAAAGAQGRGDRRRARRFRLRAARRLRRCPRNARCTC